MAASLDARLDRLGWIGPSGAVACLVALLAAALLPAPAWRAWLGAAFLWASMPIGALAILMIMRLTPGDWSEELGPFMEAQTLLLPISALLIAPVLIEINQIYPWPNETQPTAFRAAYLSTPIFIGRTVLWYGLLFALTALLVLRERRSTAAACVGLVLLVVYGTFISTDWLLSLDPEFASSGFGLYVLDIQMLTAFAVMLAALAVSGRGIRRPGILGALLLCLLLFWSYLAFMHFVITWANNLPKGVAWYRRRAGPWGVVLWAVAVSRLAPTFLLFFQTVRRSPRMLLALCGVIILGSALEAAWLTLPARGTGPAGGADIALFAFANLAMAALVIGGFFRAFAWRAARDRR